MSKIILDASVVARPKQKDANSLLDDLSEIDSMEQVVPLSTFKPKKEKKKKEIDELEEVTQESTDDWLQTVATFRREPIRTHKPRGSSGLFDFADSGEENKRKKKKNKKKKDNMVDYAKELEPQINILENIMEDQIRFTASLQRRYDALENTKSAARGIGKFTTDLVGQINQARTTTMQITDKIISAKKAIADLQMKQRKEMGAAGTENDIGQYSANLLKQIISYDRKELGVASADSVPEEGDENALFDGLSQSLEDSGYTRDSEVDTYMKYGTNAEIRVVVDKESKEYEFEAVDKTTGEVLDDYPLPTINRLEINANTGIASDEYYTKYPIRWV